MATRRVAVAALSGWLGVLAAVGSFATLFEACTTSSSGATGGQPIGDYCNQMLPTLCAYAASQCGYPLQSCEDQARTACCQGACARSAVPAKPIADCLHAYAGDEAGVDEEGGQHTTRAGLDCASVEAGIAPPECQNVFQLQ